MLRTIANIAKLARLERIPLAGGVIRDFARTVNSYTFREAGIEAIIDDEVPVRLSPNAFTGGRYTFDIQLLNELRSNAKQGVCFMDIGSHIGIASLLVDSFCKSQCRIAAFEPNPKVFPLLVENSRINGMRIETYNAALSDYCGVSSFYTNGSDPNASLSRESPGKYWYWEDKTKPKMLESRIPTTTADAFCHAFKFEPTLIKLDVEGAELQVLRGGIQTIRKHLPIILLETHVFAWESFGYDHHDLEREIELLGYDIFTPDGSRHQLPLGVGSNRDNNHYILRPK